MEKSCIWNFKIVEDRTLPKSWEEFLGMFPGIDVYLLPNRAIKDAVNTLCKLIWLRNCYNGDWVPDWTNNEIKWIILFSKNTIETTTCTYVTASELYFKSEELRDWFLSNFRALIEKLKPLYGIMKGAKE